jgi:hypothetical protein
LPPGKAGDAAALVYFKPTIKSTGFAAEEILTAMTSALILVMSIGLCIEAAL